jgi:carboxypeptidase D
MRFSTCVSALAIAAGVASAAHHSGRSLKHVGKADKPRNHARREQPQGQQQTRRSTDQYLTNSTSSKNFDPNLKLVLIHFQNTS